MDNKKTDMLTPEQFNEIYENNNKKINCLGYAIGVDEERMELDYFDGRKIEDSFVTKLEKYGLIVKKVESLDELEGKTGFILYGFYPIRTFFGFENKDFHVVRVNPDGTFVHMQDFVGLHAKRVNLLDKRGAIEEYNAKDEPIQLFMLVEEKYKDTKRITERINTVFSQIGEILNSDKIGEDKKITIRQELRKLNDILRDQGETMTSNDINILLQKVSILTKQNSLEIDYEDYEPNT